MTKLIVERLRELLDYDPVTGIFIWRVDRMRPRKGQVAGTRHPKGGFRIIIDGRGYHSHRLAWLYFYGKWPKDQIDHIDLNRANNAIVNLREATNGQNGANKKMYANNKCGYKGVHFKPREGYIAQIKLHGKVRRVGVYADPLTAHVAYVAAATLLHGQFARAS